MAMVGSVIVSDRGMYTQYTMYMMYTVYTSV
jgi:hypothetical protein